MSADTKASFPQPNPEGLPFATAELLLPVTSESAIEAFHEVIEGEAYGYALDRFADANQYAALGLEHLAGQIGGEQADFFRVGFVTTFWTLDKEAAEKKLRLPEFTQDYVWGKIADLARAIQLLRSQGISPQAVPTQVPFEALEPGLASAMSYYFDKVEPEVGIAAKRAGRLLYFMHREWTPPKPINPFAPPQNPRMN